MRKILKSKLIIKTIILATFLLFITDLALSNTFISGVQLKGSDITDPNPKESKYLKTFTGGFGIQNQDAYYRFIISIKEPFSRPMFVKVEFKNPIDKKTPIIYEVEIPVDHKTLTFTHGPVKGLKIYKTYLVKVFLYEVDNKKDPVDILKQKVRSYVDTTTDTIRFYGGLSSHPDPYGEGE